MKRSVVLCLLALVLGTAALGAETTVRVKTEPWLEGRTVLATEVSREVLDLASLPVAEQDYVVRIEVVNVDDALIICGPFAGKGSLVLKNTAPWLFDLGIWAEGYHSWNSSLWVESGKQYRLKVRLVRQQSRLVVEGPEDTLVMVDGEVEGAEAVMDSGARTVRLQRFGYEAWEGRVLMEPDTTVRLAVDFSPATFAIHGQGMSRRVFSPRNHGILGTTSIRFKVSGPGSGMFQVRDAEGLVVAEKPLGPFATWSQALTWDGRADDGTLLADGRYSWSMEATGDDGMAGSVSGTVDLESAQVLRPASVGNGLSGTDLGPDTRVLPGGALDLGVRGAGSFGETAPGSAFGLGLRMGLGLGLEAAAGLGAVYGEGQYVEVNGGLKWAALPRRGEAGLSLALGLSGSWPVLNADLGGTLGRLDGGFGGQVVMGLFAGPWGLDVGPELVVVPGATPGLALGGQAQLSLEEAAWKLSVGGSLRSKPLDAGGLTSMVAGKARAGAEFRTMLGDGPFHLGLEAGAEVLPRVRGYGSLSLGLVY